MRQQQQQLQHRQRWSWEDLERNHEQASVAQVQFIPPTRLVGSLLTVGLPSPMEETSPHRFMVEPSNGSISELQFENFP